VDLAEDLELRERQLNRFKRLLGELTRGELTRNAFEKWEITLLLDFNTCQLPARRRQDILKQYGRAVERQMESAGGPPMMLSEFLVLREQRRTSTLEERAS
jgi:hypothetical protein